MSAGRMKSSRFFSENDQINVFQQQADKTFPPSRIALFFDVADLVLHLFAGSSWMCLLRRQLHVNGPVRRLGAGQGSEKVDKVNRSSLALASNHRSSEGEICGGQDQLLQRFLVDPAAHFVSRTTRARLHRTGTEQSSLTVLWSR